MVNSAYILALPDVMTSIWTCNTCLTSLLLTNIQLLGEIWFVQLLTYFTVLITLKETYKLGRFTSWTWCCKTEQPRGMRVAVHLSGWQLSSPFLRFLSRCGAQSPKQSLILLHKEGNKTQTKLHCFHKHVYSHLLVPNWLPASPTSLI